MATGQWSTLVDVASRTDPDGNIAVVAEMLSQCNQLNEDLPYVEANERTGHQFSFRTSIPSGAWRMYNQGTGYHKSTTARSRVGMGMLADYSQVDQSLAEHSGDVERFRESEDMAFLEGMGQTVTETFIYGNAAVDPAAFMGLAPFYSTLSMPNVLSGGGTGSSNTSLWLLGMGSETIFGLFPRGSQAGLKSKNKGDVVPAYDSLGNPYEAYTMHFSQEVGLCPKDWRWGSRLANLDVTNAGLAGSNPADLFVFMDQMLLLLPKATMTTSGIDRTDAPSDPDTGIRTVFYSNRTVAHYMAVQAMRNRNTLIGLKDYDGMPITGFRDIPCKKIDQIVNTEAVVS